MELQFRVSHGTMKDNPDGVFVTSDKVRIRKNAKLISQSMGEDTIEMWEYQEWRGSIEDYIKYTNDLLNLPSNQLQIVKIEDNIQHEPVEVVSANDIWTITMYNDEEITQDGKYSYNKLTFERPIQDESLTAEMVIKEYEMYRESMFEFAIYPESPIRANRDSLIPLMNAIIEQQKTISTQQQTINSLITRIEFLEGGN